MSRHMRRSAGTLGTQVVRAAVWNAVGTLSARMATLVTGIVAARLLAPSDYAVGGTALAVAGLLTVITAGGFAQALVQCPLLSELACHTVFWFMSITGFGMTLLGVVSAPVLARFYGQPALVPVLCMMSVGLSVSMVGAVPNALLQRTMRFREINAIAILTSILSACVAIAIACLGGGFWALVTPMMGTWTVGTIGAIMLSRYRPRLRFSWGEFKAVSSFGFSVLASGVLQYLADNGDYLVLGRFWNAVDFGYYYFAFERSRRPVYLVLSQLNSALFPALSRVQDDPDRLRRAFLTGTRQICLIVFPLYVHLIILADWLVPWLFGRQWEPAVPAFRVFASFAFLRALAALVPSTLLAIGRPQALARFNLFRVVVILPVLLGLGLAGAGVLTASMVLVSIWAVQLPFLIMYLYRTIGIRIQEVSGSVARLAIAAGAMAATAVAIRVAGQQTNLPSFMVIGATVVSSSLLFIALTWRQLLELWQKLTSAFGLPRVAKAAADWPAR